MVLRLCLVIGLMTVACRKADDPEVDGPGFVVAGSVKVPDGFDPKAIFFTHLQTHRGLFPDDLDPVPSHTFEPDDDGFQVTLQKKGDYLVSVSDTNYVWGLQNLCQRISVSGSDAEFDLEFKRRPGELKFSVIDSDGRPVSRSRCILVPARGDLADLAHAGAVAYTDQSGAGTFRMDRNTGPWSLRAFIKGDPGSGRAYSCLSSDVAVGETAVKLVAASGRKREFAFDESFKSYGIPVGIFIGDSAARKILARIDPPRGKFGLHDLSESGFEFVGLEPGDYCMKIQMSRRERGESTYTIHRVEFSVNGGGRPVVLKPNPVSTRVYATSDLKSGTRAPALSGKSVDGRRLNLADYRGRPVCIVFWGFW